MPKKPYEPKGWESGHQTDSAYSSAVRLPHRNQEDDDESSRTTASYRLRWRDDGKRDVAAVVSRRTKHIQRVLDRSQNDRLRLIVRSEEDLRYLLT